MSENELAQNNADTAALGTYGDAKVLAPYTEASPQLAQEMIVSLGASKESQRWKPQAMPIGAFVAKLCRHEVGAKDGPSYVLGDMVAGRRLKTAVKALYAVGLDIDTGTSVAQIEKALLDLGCLAVRYSTHSHLKLVTEFKRDRLAKWAEKDADGADFEDDGVLRRFLTEVEKWDPEIVATAIYKGDEHQDRGIMAMVEHKAMPKHRIVVPFAKAFIISEQSGTQADAMKKWGKVPTALAQKLGVPLDESCLDPSRLFYFPRHAKGKPFDVSLVGGPLFDWTSLVLDDPWEAEVAKLTKSQSKSQTSAGRDLGRWSMKRGHGFQIVQAIEDYCPEHLRNQTASGWEITCPFDEEHSNPGDPDDRACMAVNAGDGPSEWFSVRCLHETCKPKTNLDMVGKMIEDGWFARDVLDDESYDAVADPIGTGAGKGPSEVYEFTDDAQLVAALNRKIAMVRVSGDVRFVFRDEPEPALYSRRAMETALARWRRVWDEDGKPKSRPAFLTWIESPDLAEYTGGVEFQPDLSKADPRCLNLFRGFATEPAGAGGGGSYELFADHINNQVAGGDGEKAAYFWAWAADIFQNPGRKPGVAVILRGEKGCGKSTVGEVLSHLIGERYAPIIDSAEGLTGRFSAHLERALLLNVEEAMHAADPRAEGRFKALITGTRISIEKKGIDTRDVPSYFRVLMTTNASHVAPASGAERRFAVFDVTDGHLQDGAYFGAMRAELEAGGYEALMRDLLTRDISAIDLRKPPRTAGLADQIRLSLKSDHAWWAGILETGTVPYVRPPVDSDAASFDWPHDREMVISRADLFASFSQFCPGYRGPPNPAALGKFITTVCPAIRSTKATVAGDRFNAYVLPSRDTAKAAFLRIHPGLVLENQEGEAPPQSSGQVVAVDFRRRHDRAA